MSKHCLYLFAIIFLLVGCSSHNGETNTGSADPRTEGAFTLYRLDGDRYPGDPVPEGAVLLHGWPILQTCSITAVTTREDLFNALDDGIANRGSVPIDCFNPRHAIRVNNKGVNVDYLICFQCQNYEIWNDNKRIRGGMTSSSPKSTFNQVLDNCQQAE